MNTAVLLLSAVLVVLSQAHISDFPGTPRLNASAEDFSALWQHLQLHYHTLLSAPGWKAMDGPSDSVNYTTMQDPDSGCPWLRATATLHNCSIEASARFIVTELDTYQHQWDARLLSRQAARRLPLFPNGSQEVDWFEYDTGALLQHRGYYNYGGWQWTGPLVLEDATTSAYSAISPPQNSTERLVRMAGRQWKRLTALDAETVQYDVLQLSDIYGIVPCGITLTGQAAALNTEIEAYRSKIPGLPRVGRGARSR